MLNETFSVIFSHAFKVTFWAENVAFFRPGKYPNCTAGWPAFRMGQCYTDLCFKSLFKSHRIYGQRGCSGIKKWRSLGFYNNSG